MNDEELQKLREHVQISKKATTLSEEFNQAVMKLEQAADSSRCYSKLKTSVEKKSSETYEKVLGKLNSKLTTDLLLSYHLLRNNLFDELKELLEKIKEPLSIYYEISDDAINILSDCPSESSLSSVYRYLFGTYQSKTGIFPKIDYDEIQKQLTQAIERTARRNEARRNGQYANQYRRGQSAEQSAKQSSTYEKEQKEKKQREDREQAQKEQQRKDRERAQREQDAQNARDARDAQDAKAKEKSYEGNDACFSTREGFIPEQQCYAKYLDTLRATSVTDEDITNCPEKVNTLREIKKAYFKQSKISHPDKSGSNELFQRVGLAYNLLIETIDRLCNDFSGGSIQRTKRSRNMSKSNSKSKSKSPTRKRSPVRTKKAKSHHAKVLNPKTGRYVLKGGRIGSQIIAELESM
jgi:hypothetical protein